MNRVAPIRATRAVLLVVLLLAPLVPFVPTAAATVTTTHTAAYSSLSAYKKSLSDQFTMPTGSPGGRNCGAAFPAVQDAASASYTAIAGRQYFLFVGATFGTASNPEVQTLIGSSSGTIFTVNFDRITGTPSIPSSLPGTNPQVTTWTYNDQGLTGAMAAIYFTAPANEHYSIGCATSMQIFAIYSPNIQNGVNHVVMAFVDTGLGTSNSCPVSTQCDGALVDAFEATVPSAPVLSVTVSGAVCSLSWTTPANGGFPIQGYNVSRVNPDGGDPRVFALGVVNAMTDGALTTNRTYNVTAWSQVGTSAASNAVSCRQAVVPLFGDSSVLYGPGGSAGLATALQTSVAGATILYGIVVVMLFAGIGFAFFGAPGAIIGAVFGLFIAIAAGMFPLWLIVLLLVVSAAAFLLFRGRGGGA